MSILFIQTLVTWRAHTHTHTRTQWHGTMTADRTIHMNPWNMTSESYNHDSYELLWLFIWTIHMNTIHMNSPMNILMHTSLGRDIWILDIWLTSDSDAFVWIVIVPMNSHCPSYSDVLWIPLWDMTSESIWRKMTIHMNPTRDSFLRVTWHDIWILSIWILFIWILVTIYMNPCDMANAQVWRDSYTGVTWLIHMCDVTHSYVWRDSFIGVTWLIHRCDVTHL